MEKKMFYKASPLIFQNARLLRDRMTDAEIKLWEFLRTKPNGFKFRRQHPLSRYVVDFFCYKLKLVIEADGAIHNRSDIKANDAERQKTIEAEGIKVLRFTNDEILNQTEAVITKIQTYLVNE